MTYQEILNNARTCMGPYCKSCPTCNGLACKNTVPGPGAKGIGTGFIRNYQKWQELCVNMDTICENKPVDTSYNFFGKQVVLPVFAAPVGAMQLHYGDKYDDLTYNDILVSACADAGIAAFTGDGTNPAVIEAAAEALKKNHGCGVPTVKPWNMALVEEKMALVKAADPIAIAMDIDAAGLGDLPPHLAQTAFHLPLGILMRSAVIHRTAAHAEDAQPLYGHELVLDAVAALGRGLFIAPVVIAADIQHRRAPHRHKEAQVFGLQVTAGQDEVDAVQPPRHVIVPEKAVLMVGYQKQLHTCTSPLSGIIQSLYTPSSRTRDCAIGSSSSKPGMLPSTQLHSQSICSSSSGESQRVPSFIAPPLCAVIFR